MSTFPNLLSVLENLKYQLKIIDFLKFTVKANNDVLGFSSGLCFRNEYSTCVYIYVYIYIHVYYIYIILK